MDLAAVRIINNNNNNNNGLYINHIIRVTLQFCKGEIGRQHIEGASGCRFSPYVISPQPTQTNVHKDQTITPGTPRPTLCDKCVGSLTSHRVMNIEVL